MVTRQYPAAGRQPRAILARFPVFLIAPFVMTALAGPGDPPGSARELAPAFETLIERYLCEVRGVGCSLPGDMSADSFQQRIAAQSAILEDLEAVDRGTLTLEQDIDWRFLRGILKANIRAESDVQRWRQDPRQYVFTNGLIFKIEADHRHPDERGRDLVAELQTLRARLVNAETNLTEFIPNWLPYANARIDGTVIVMQEHLRKFASRLSPDLRDALIREAEQTVEALGRFRRFVNEDWTERPEGDFRIGADLYNYLHEHRHQIPTADRALEQISRGERGFTRMPDYHDWGWKQYEIVEGHLERKAASIDPDKTWKEIIRETKSLHPFNEQLVYEGIVLSRKTREWTIENDLVSIPWEDDDMLMVASDPSMAASQWWGFGPGYLPAGHPSTKMAWPIIPIQPEWPADVAEENLTEKDWSFYYAIGPHEAYPGHHLMRLYRHRNDRPLRRYEYSYSDQAWCYYVEWELTPRPEYGFFPEEMQDRYELEILRLKLWRMGRVIIDSGLHGGRMTWDEAVTVESERTGFVRRGAEINIDGIAGGGTNTAAPTIGYFQWMLLRDDYFNKMRELDQQGTLKDFHDRVYRIGFIPVELVRDQLMVELEREYRPEWHR
ncbi:DUF885 family protein [Chromatocurvus halotolerans]|uniref:Uncharacterized protein (DUF885 family) n=1 Tax=Chromatocurvus halotolerans TaxID=1132028 RepID=A0A4R2KZW9_9GAMM|nr:DUF885 family protein [Chromatocurvus halotolerans]TCO77019.1 uncharacterized protein (DUF885 family) [Chromatocurvus halotolerans]